MNKRQKKKLFKQTLIKVRKIHPQKGDVICLQPNLDWIDIKTMCQFMKLYSNNDIFGKAKLTFVPTNIKQLSHKKHAQMYIDKLQNTEHCRSDGGIRLSFLYWLILKDER